MGASKRPCVFEVFGVGWEGCDNVHVSCVQGDATWMSPHEAHRSFWLIRLFSPSRHFFLFAFSMNTFALIVSSSISLLQMLEPRALWMLQARVNFKGVEKSFLSCCLQDIALKLVSEMFFFWL